MVSTRVFYISSLYENDDFIGFLLVSFLKVATLVNQTTRSKSPKKDQVKNMSQWSSLKISNSRNLFKFSLKLRLSSFRIPSSAILTVIFNVFSSKVHQLKYAQLKSRSIFGRPKIQTQPITISDIEIMLCVWSQTVSSV